MKQFSPAADRNKAPIGNALMRFLPASGLVLEVASGTGQHIAFFAKKFPRLQWQPTDRTIDLFASVSNWVREAGVTNVKEPILLDALTFPWDVTQADAILCINMVHISPWEATCGLLKGAGQLLAPGSPLVLYGPYWQKGVEDASTNRNFDESLRMQSPAYGIRHLEDVTRQAAVHGFDHVEIMEMPVNNLLVVLSKPIV